MNARRFLLYVILVSVAMPVHFAAAAQTQASHPLPLAAQQDQHPLSRTEVIDIIAATRKIVSPNGIEELLSLPINGSIQWLSIRGRDRRNPILLFLHGGPGSPTMPVAYTFQSPWEDYFTVVQWDQRGTGKTYAANDPKRLASSITIEEMTSDAEEVVRYLLKQYGKRGFFSSDTPGAAFSGLPSPSATLNGSMPIWV